MPKLRLGDLDLYYEEAGTGPALLMLHGLGASLEDWEFQVPEFARYFRVITPDLRGFGRSGRGTQPASIARFAQDMAALLDHLRIDSFFLVGYSMGGAVAQELALMRPQAVPRMVIANSMPTFRPQTLRQRFEVFYRLVVMSVLGPERLARISAQRMFPDQPEIRAASISRGIAYNTRSSYLRALRALTSWSALERLSAEGIVAIGPDEVPGLLEQVRETADAKFGDYSGTMAMALAKRAGKKPRDVAIAIIERLDVGDVFENPTEPVGPGFINVKVRDDALSRAVAAAARGNFRMAVAIVEPSGELVAFARMDDTQYGSILVAQRKARTAARYRLATSVMEERTLAGRIVSLANDDALPIAGGVPIVVDGRIVGAIGVSGATAAQDAEVATAALAAD